MIHLRELNAKYCHIEATLSDKVRIVPSAQLTTYRPGNALELALAIVAGFLRKQICIESSTKPETISNGFGRIAFNLNSVFFAKLSPKPSMST